MARSSLVPPSVLVVLGVALQLGACGETASFPTPVITPSQYSLSGVITETTAQGVRPSSGAHVNAWVQMPRFGYSYWYLNGPVTSDARGHYLLSALPAGARVQLELSSEGYFQQCAAPNLTMTSDATLHAQLVSSETLSADPSSVAAPLPGFRLISGIVYGADRKPVGGAGVTYDSAPDSPAAYTRTDSAGRYLLCGIPDSKEVRLYAGASGQGDSWVVVVPGQSTGVDIVLSP